MPGVSRLHLEGLKVCIELRQSVNRFFVVYPELGQELVMAFEHRWTAYEIAVNVYHATPFYTKIPTVDYQSPWPRVGPAYPRVGPIDIPFTITA